MISVPEAYSLVLKQTLALQNEVVPLSQTRGRRLAQNILADHDFPPFNRAMMDGFAITFEKWEMGQKSFRCHLTQSAGEPPKENIADECIEIMTGATVPDVFNCIIPVEQVTSFIDNQVFFDDAKPVKLHQHIHFKATDSSKGQLLIKEGTYLRSHHIATLASNGYNKVAVQQQPSIAIVATGDELVEVEATPLPHQIRKSNVFAIEALVKYYSDNIQLFHLQDEPTLIEEWLKKKGNQFDILIFTGGVSKGKKDYLPHIWSLHGYEKIFHGVSQKPGKPMYFGKKGNQLLFGLPGNPLSSLFCARRYIIPFLQRQLGNTAPTNNILLIAPLENTTAMTQWHPVQFKNEQWTPVTFNGSGDVNGIVACTGFVELPPHSMGSTLPYFELS
jgi:molybdopterin molybdotransferase